MTFKASRETETFVKKITKKEKIILASFFFDNIYIFFVCMGVKYSLYIDL